MQDLPHSVGIGAREAARGRAALAGPGASATGAAPGDPAARSHGQRTEGGAAAHRGRRGRRADGWPLRRPGARAGPRDRDASREDGVISDKAPEWPAERLWLWSLLFPPIRRIVRTLFRVRADGRENLPASGPYIVVANHINWKDPPLISITLGLSVRYMAKIQAFGYPLLGYLVRATGAFPVRRGEGDRRALVTAMRVLGSGQILGFFPEGHRSENAKLLRGKPGVGFIASRVPDAPLVPVAM